MPGITASKPVITPARESAEDATELASTPILDRQTSHPDTWTAEPALKSTNPRSAVAERGLCERTYLGCVNNPMWS